MLFLLAACTPEPACTDCDTPEVVVPFTACAVDGAATTLVNVPRNTALPSPLGFGDHVLVSYEDVAPDGTESIVGLVNVDAALTSPQVDALYTDRELSSNPVLVPVAGGAMAVWSYQDGLLGLRLDEAGGILAGPFDLGAGYHHEVAANGADGVVIAWTPDNDAPGGVGRWSADGSLLASGELGPIDALDGIVVVGDETWVFGFGDEPGLQFARFDAALQPIDGVMVADEAITSAHSSTVLSATAAEGRVHLTVLIEQEIGTYELVRGHLTDTGELEDREQWNPEGAPFYSATAFNDGRAEVTAWSNDEDAIAVRASVASVDGAELLAATDLSDAAVSPRIEAAVAAVEDGYLVVWRFFDLGANALEARHIACE